MFSQCVGILQQNKSVRSAYESRCVVVLVGQVDVQRHRGDATGSLAVPSLDDQRQVRCRFAVQKVGWSDRDPAGDRVQHEGLGQFAEHARVANGAVLVRIGVAGLHLWPTTRHDIVPPPQKDFYWESYWSISSTYPGHNGACTRDAVALKEEIGLD